MSGTQFGDLPIEDRPADMSDEMQNPDEIKAPDGFSPLIPEPTTRESFTYAAFISYSHKDKNWAEWLHRSLERYELPSGFGLGTTSDVRRRARFGRVFRDREELAPGPSLRESIVRCAPQSHLW